MCLGKQWATNAIALKERLLNSVIAHCPAWIQILFMGRVIKSVKADLEAQKAKVLLQEKEGNLRTGRRYRPGYSIPDARMDLLRVQRENQSEITTTKLYGGYG